MAVQDNLGGALAGTSAPNGEEADGMETDADADVAVRGTEKERGLGFAFDALEPRLPTLTRRRVPAVQREEVPGLKLRLARPDWSALVLELQKTISGAGKGTPETEKGLEPGVTGEMRDGSLGRVSEQRGVTEGPVNGEAEHQRAAGEGERPVDANDRASNEEIADTVRGEGSPVRLKGREARGQQGIANGTEKNGTDGGGIARSESAGCAWTLQTPLLFEIANEVDLVPEKQAERLAITSGASIDAVVPEARDNVRAESGNKAEKHVEAEKQAVDAGGVPPQTVGAGVERAPDVKMTDVAETSSKAVGQAGLKDELHKDRVNGSQGIAEETAQVVEAVALLEGAVVINLEQLSAGSPEQGVDLADEQKEGPKNGSVAGANESGEQGKSARVITPTKAAKGREGGAEKRERRMTRALRERGSKEKEKKGEGKKKEEAKKAAEVPKPRDVWATLGRFVAGSAAKGLRLSGAPDGSKGITDGNEKGGGEKSKPSRCQKENGQSEPTCNSAEQNPADAPLSRSAGFEAFLDMVKENSGALDVGARLLEQLAGRADVALNPPATDALLIVESLTRNWGAERSPQCSLWLAQLYLDRAEKRWDGESPEGVRERTEAAARDANRCLCEVVEWWAVRNAEDESGFGGVLHPGEGTPREGGESEQNAGDTSAEEQAGGRVGVGNVNALDWRFWAKFHWAASRLAFLEGKRVRGIECVHECAKILERSTSADEQIKEVSPAANSAGRAPVEGAVAELSPMDVETLASHGDQPNSRDDGKVLSLLTSQGLPRGARETLQLGCGLQRRTLALSDVRAKLQELETDELLTRSVAALRFAGDFEGLVHLLAPVVLPGWEAPGDVTLPSAGVSQGGVDSDERKLVRTTPADVSGEEALGRQNHADVNRGAAARETGADGGGTLSDPSRGFVADVSKHPPALDTRRRLEALRALLDACQNAGPQFLLTELRARGEVLGILARVSGWLDGGREAWLEFDVEGAFGGVGTAGVPGGGTVEERAEKMERVGRLVGAELRAIGECSRGLRDVREKGPAKVSTRERHSRIGD